MTQKQIVLAAVIAVVAGLAFVIIYRQFVGPVATDKTTPSALQSGAGNNAKNSAPEAKSAAIPSSIDGIAKDIESETAIDLSALDEEASGELSEIETDSQNITGLGESYDENNL